MSCLKEIYNGGVTSPQGFLAAGVKAYIKKDKKDLAVIFSEAPAAAAGVFTTNKVKAAPLLITEEHLKNGRARAVVVNAGNANACTGQEGLNNAVTTAQKAGELLHIDPHDVIVTSTGVIGVQLPMDRVLAGVEKAVGELHRDGGAEAAQAIMTTDTVPKEIAVEFTVGNKRAVIGGMAKGSGMIHPNMATMLGFVTTDAAVSPALLAQALKYAVDRTFNMVTVDGDTSTNDMVVALANGQAGNPEIVAEDSDYLAFRDALLYVCTYLAKLVAKDGEGATKLVEIRVVNAASEADAKKAAKAVANSNLVKTAIFGEDANWGRIICAVGYSGAEFDPARVDIAIGDEMMCADGTPLNFSEERAKKILEQDEVTIIVDMKSGSAEAVAWTCDFSYDYVKINADYRT